MSLSQRLPVLRCASIWGTSVHGLRRTLKRYPVIERYQHRPQSGRIRPCLAEAVNPAVHRLDRRRSGRHLLPSGQCPRPNNPDYDLRALVPFRKHGLTVRPRNLAALNAPGPQRSNGGQCRRMCPRRQRPRQSDYACSGSACRPEPR
jgi:hypothetical protein